MPLNAKRVFFSAHFFKTVNMKRSSKSLTGYSITAIDGELGSVTDFYFDDDTWTVRYLLVETGSWLSGRKVLISPQVIQRPDWEAKTFYVNLTKEQVKNSPGVDTAKPVSRQHEILLSEYYPWPAYWAGGLGVTGMMAPAMPPLEQAVRESGPNDEEAGDPHLRSIDRVTGYIVKAVDGEIGDIEAFLLDEKTLAIDFFVVDTGRWFPGKKVVLSPALIEGINWKGPEVTVNATVEQIKAGPEYNADEPLTEGQAEELQNHYRRHLEH